MMFKFSLRLILLFAFTTTLVAQKFEDDIVFDVSKYDIRKVGYPSRIIGDGAGNTVYYEYWEPGSGRQFSGYYLQSLDADYAERWFKPVFGDPAQKFEPMNLFALENSLVVCGYQYLPKEKKWAGYAHFYDTEGADKGLLPMDPAALKKFEAGFSDIYSVSPDKKRLVRMHYNPASGAKSPIYVSAMLADGKLEWAAQLKLPLADEKYKPVHFSADNKGKIWILMTKESMTGKFENDKLSQPAVVMYNFRDNSYHTYKVQVPEAIVPAAQIDITPEGNLLLALAVGDLSSPSFTNATRNGKPVPWSRLQFMQLTCEKDWIVVDTAVITFSEAHIQKLNFEGADFSGNGTLLQQNGYAVWLLESQYSQLKEQGKVDFYAEVLMAPVRMKDMEAGPLQIVEKKQRDLAGSVMCSFVTAMSESKVHLVYLSSVGADGQIMAASLNLEDMTLTQKSVLSNEDGTFYFNPAKSGSTATGNLILMGMGRTTGQEYRLIRITF
jgi:hypothetical protein